MSSQSASGSSATPHTNPFLEQTSGTYTSQVPLSGSHPTTVDDITSGGTSSSSSLTGGSSSTLRNADGTTSSAGQEIRAQAQNSDTAASVQQKAQEATQDFKQSLASLTDGQTKPGLAGDLAPSQSPIDPKAAPEGTEHVTNILSGVAGAILSAPAAALEVASPTAASKLSDGVAAISARLPALSLQDATNAVQNAANAAYSKVPEGTADTVKSYVGAAQTKAAEVAPPALGGSTTRGNTGEGQTAKTPAQLADETKQTTGNVLSNAAATAQAYVSQALGFAQQKGSEAAAATQQAASDASVKAQELTNTAAAKAQDASAVAQQTARDASNTASAKAQDASAAVQQTAAEASQRAQQTAQNVGQSAQQTAQSAQHSAQQTAQNVQQSAHETAQSAQQQQPTSSSTTSTYSASVGQPSYAHSSSEQTAADLLNRTAASNTLGHEQQSLGSNNPYGARPTGEESAASAHVTAALVDQQRHNLASTGTVNQQ